MRKQGLRPAMVAHWLPICIHILSALWIAQASKFEAFNRANGYSTPSSEASGIMSRSFLAPPKKRDGVRAYQIAPIHSGMCHPPQSEAVRHDLLEHLGNVKRVMLRYKKNYNIICLQLLTTLFSYNLNLQHAGFQSQLPTATYFWEAARYRVSVRDIVHRFYIFRNVFIFAFYPTCHWFCHIRFAGSLGCLHLTGIGIWIWIDFNLSTGGLEDTDGKIITQEYFVIIHNHNIPEYIVEIIGKYTNAHKVLYVWYAHAHAHTHTHYMYKSNISDHTHTLSYYI